MSFSRPPRVSILMPVYNGERYIKEAIDSLLAQSFKDFELIIINDDSPDNSEVIIMKYDDPRIIYLKNEQNKGIAATRNRGLKQARGEYIALQDDDDISFPQRLEKQVAYLDRHPEVGVVSSTIEILSTYQKKKNIIKSSPEHVSWFHLLKGCPVICSATMFRKSLIEEHGMRFSNTFKTSDDYYLWTQFRQYTNIVNLPDVLIQYRWHGNNTSITRKECIKQEDIRIQRSILATIAPPGCYLTPCELLQATSLTSEQSVSAENLLSLLTKNFLFEEPYEQSNQLIFLKWYIAQYIKRSFLRSDYNSFVWNNPFSHYVSFSKKIRYTFRGLLYRHR